MGHNATDLVSSAVAASFLGTLPASILTELEHGALLHHVEAGRIFIDLDAMEPFGIVVSGLARVYLEPVGGPQLTVRYARAGAAVGVAALVGQPHPVTVRTVTRSQILELDVGRVLAAARTEPMVSLAVTRELAACLLDTYEELAVRVRGSVRQRLARQLLEEIDVTGLAEGQVLRRTHDELAEAIGSAREVVSRTLASFAQDGLVELGRGRIRIMNGVLLDAEAGKRVVPRD